MPRKHDTNFKAMFAQNFLALLRWLLPGVASAEVVKLPSELPSTMRQADLIIRVRFKTSQCRVRPPDKLVLFECQCQYDKKLRPTMLLRAVLAHIIYDLPVKTIVLALSPLAVVPAIYIYGDGDDGEKLRHSVTVRRVFDESADEALASDIADLLPIVTVMKSRDGDHAALLQRVIERIVDCVLQDEKRKIMLEQAATFATLRLPKKKVDGIVDEVLRRKRTMLNPLRDFPYLRETRREARRDARREAKAEFLAKGKAESVLALLVARGIQVRPSLRKKILACKDIPLLDRWFHTAVTATSVAQVLAVN